MALLASGLLVAAFALAVIAGLDLTRIRIGTPILRDRTDLARFRRAVHRQRWAALVIVLLLVAAGMTFLVGLISGRCRADELPFSFAAGVPLLIAEWWLRYVESRFRSTPAANPKLGASWQQFVLWWEDHPIPDWG